jgi:hypothetical protein
MPLGKRNETLDGVTGSQDRDARASRAFEERLQSLGYEPRSVDMRGSSGTSITSAPRLDACQAATATASIKIVTRKASGIVASGETALLGHDCSPASAPD